MSILSTFIVPHPPLIVPQIGKGQEEAIRKTTEAYKEIGQRIARLKPKTIVIITPHSEMYSDYIHISPADRAQGDFRDFGAPQVRFQVNYDIEYRHVLIDLINQRKIPAGTLGERKKGLDHGTMVPLYFINQYYNDYKLVRISISGLSRLTHYDLGKCLFDAADKTDKSVVIVASGDLSHKLKDDGPYGFIKEGPEFDHKITRAMSQGDFMSFLQMEEEFTEAAAECGLRSFIIMAGALDGKAVKSELLSYEGPFGVGYGVASFEIIGEDPNRHFGLKYKEVQEEKVIQIRSKESEPVRLARQSLEYYIKNRNVMPCPKDLSADLTERKAGTFVSIYLEGRLRGCIGTVSPVRRNIAEEIIQNAVSAGTQDPRFSQVEEIELPRLVYSVDILTEAEVISSKAELNPSEYGVIVESKGRRGLLLPDLEGVDTIDAQVNIALQKAGISPNEPYTMKRFKVVRYK